MNQVDDQSGFRECARCRRATPAAAATCIYCGYAPESTAQNEEETEHKFFGALFSRSTPLTYVLIGLNLAVFVLMWLAGGMRTMWADPVVLIGFGAKENSLIDNEGQYWRLVTSIFIHIGFIHFLFNNYALWIIGREIERLYGSARFALLYLLSGMAGSIASYWFNPEAASAGASGAIFGLFGVLATFAFRHRHEIPGVLRREIPRRVIPLIVINLLLGFTIPQIDNAAHIGGLVSGVLLCVVVPYKRPDEKQTRLAWRIPMLAALALVAASFAAAARSYDGPAPDLSNLRTQGDELIPRYVNNMSRAQQHLIASVNPLLKSFETPRNAIELEPAREAADAGLETLRGTPRLNHEADLFRHRLSDLLMTQKEAVDSAQAGDGRDRTSGLKELSETMERYRQFEVEYNSWLSGFLAKYGYRFEKTPAQQ